MTDKISTLLPFYNPRVKVSSWSYINQGLPFDNVNSKNKGASHYKSFGDSHDVYIPKTSAKEAMEIGAQKLIRCQYARRTIVNFTSFPLVDSILQTAKVFDVVVKEDAIPISTYNRDYPGNDNIIIKPHFCDTVVAHPLLNRRPKDEFQQVNTYAPNKFMDSHFFDIPQNRKCINYLRQIRNTSNVF